MMDVNYFLDQAQNSTQREFELDWADVIQVFDTNQTELITEDGKELIIYWYSDGHYQGYQVIEKSTSTVAQMKQSHPGMVEEIISMLKHINVDGETMQFILEQVGMEKQMLNQLMATMPFKDVQYEYGERFYAERCKV